jgi:hypothetical protein
MNLKGCGRKQAWLNLNTIPAFGWTDKGKS